MWIEWASIENDVIQIIGGKRFFQSEKNSDNSIWFRVDPVNLVVPVPFVQFAVVDLDCRHFSQEPGVSKVFNKICYELSMILFIYFNQIRSWKLITRHFPHTHARHFLWFLCVIWWKLSLSPSFTHSALIPLQKNVCWNVLLIEIYSKKKDPHPDATQTFSIKTVRKR